MSSRRWFLALPLLLLPGTGEAAMPQPPRIEPAPPAEEVRGGGGRSRGRSRHFTQSFRFRQKPTRY